MLKKIKKENWKESFIKIQKFGFGQSIFLDKNVYLNFFYEGENYLLKLRRDCQFLKETMLNLYMRFSIKCDPFFVFGNKMEKYKEQKVEISDKCVEIKEQEYKIKNSLQKCE